MSICGICPRKCMVDRQKTLGACKSTDKIGVARASLHLWEEPCISGDNGSGTVFFSGCNLGCVYCQNRKISNGQLGRELSEEELSRVFLLLQEKGAHNINLVTPTHFAMQIKKALIIAKSKGLHIPIVYNTSGYESVATLKNFHGLVDIYLTDFKYMNSDIAKKYSNAPDYPETAKLALEEMVRQTSEAVFDDKGMMQKGVIVRHLILPSYTKDSKNIIEYIYKTYGDTVFMSIMNQFTPLENVKDYPEINRKVTQGEYDEVIDFAISLGVENAFIQEGETQSESFIPDFSEGEILKELGF